MPTVPSIPGGESAYGSSSAPIPVPSELLMAAADMNKMGKFKIPLPKPDPRSWAERAVTKAQSEEDSAGAIHPDDLMRKRGYELAPEKKKIDHMDYSTDQYQKFHGHREGWQQENI